VDWTLTCRVGGAERSGWRGPTLQPHEAREVVDQIDHADLQARPGDADGANEYPKAVLLGSKDMLDAVVAQPCDSISQSILMFPVRQRVYGWVSHLMEPIHILALVVS
jgi:hypothetical protein